MGHYLDSAYDAYFDSLQPGEESMTFEEFKQAVGYKSEEDDQ